ncbi:ATP-binding protein [Micromonospora chalcea]|uniref:ATP-binding protein n=1 Tax=Micromonospora chalcea TaxID=1874 RepID=UPI0033CF3400
MVSSSSNIVIRRHKGRLGALEDGVDQGYERLTPVLSKLAEAGIIDPTPSTRAGLTVAVVHSSYLHENQSDIPRVTRGVLEALDRLGRAFLGRFAACEIYTRGTVRSVGDLSKQVASINNGLHWWAKHQDWLAESALLGGSLERGSLPEHVLSGLFRQLLGVLCLTGETKAASRLVKEVIFQVLNDGRGKSIDFKTILQEKISPDRPIYEYERSGHDHDPSFLSTVRDACGRTGVGTGRSKKAAAQQASSEFLKKFYPSAIQTHIPSSVSRETAIEIASAPAHSRAIWHVQNLFHLPLSARPLVSQALIHSSWAYEHRAEMQKCHQQDNKVLGFIGSHVLDFEHVNIAVRHAMDSPPEEFPFLTMTNDDYGSAFQQAGLATGLLLGAGQGSLGVSREMGGNAFQAVVAAVYLAKNLPPILSSEWPADWEPILRTIAPPELRPPDATTLLGQALSIMGIEASFEFRKFGPDHASRRLAIFELESKQLGVRKKLEGVADQAKTSAKHRVASDVLAILDRIGNSSPIESLADVGDGDLSLARFLLAHQAFVLATSTVPVQRWAKANLFGLHLASTPNRLLNWAGEIDRILNSVSSIGSETGRLSETFRAAIDNSSASVLTVDDELRALLGELEEVVEPEEIGPEHVWRLVQLGDINRCLGTDDSDSDLESIIRDWAILYGRRLELPSSLPPAWLSGRERAVLDAAVSAVLAARGVATVEVEAPHPLCLRVISTVEVDGSLLGRVCGLWSGISRNVSLRAIQNGIEMAIDGARPPTEPGPITQAVLTAMRPEPDPFRSAVANLVHDLKNQVVAVRTALSQVGGSRTAQLERQLAASRHLEHAQAIALRLRAATSMRTYSESENTELGAFLRQYGVAVFSRLPRSISLLIPDAKEVAYVAISERALTAVLDNLVQNAVEAMREGGSIRLDWLADRSGAAIEVADDGPGLPVEVAQALAAGSRIRSGKLGGNGLGLWGVHALLHRIGGQLSVSSSSAGTSWLVTLPTVNSVSMEES